MNDRSTEREGAEGAGDGERSLRWAWAAGVVIPAITLLGLAGALLMTPGDPSSCRLPTSRAWLLCGWSRRFVANAGVALGVITAGSLSLALLGGFSRAVLREIRR